MRLEQCMDAYLAASALQHEKMPFRTAWALASCMAQLRDTADFFAKREKELALQYAKKDSDGKIEWIRDGTFAMADASAAEAFRAEHEELCSVEAAQGYSMPPVAPAPEQITPAQIAALHGFVEFEEGGKTYG